MAYSNNNDIVTKTCKVALTPLLQDCQGHSINDQKNQQQFNHELISF